MRKALTYKLAYALFTLLALANGCIPIEDRIDPLVEGTQVREVYFYNDTIQLSVSFSDNNQLDTGFVSIERLQGQPPSIYPPWSENIGVSLRGRRLDKDFTIAVPPFVAPGEYTLIISGRDVGGNQVTQTSNFFVQQDNIPPVFHNLAIGLSEGPDGVYQACRSEVIRITGGVSDNLSVVRLGFQLGTVSQGVLSVSADSLSVGDSFGNQVLVPPGIDNGTLLELTVFAIDTFNNRTEARFNIRVDCDDRPPVIFVGSTSPQADNGRVQVVQGMDFRINNAVVTDDRLVANVKVYYNLLGANPVLRHEISPGTASVNLHEAVDLVFPIPVETPIGQIFELTILATDSEGNTSLPFIITVTVVEDGPPVIVVTNTYINGIDTPLSPGTLNRIARRQSFTLDGKVEEQLALTLFRLAWGPESEVNQGRGQISEFREFESLPLNLIDYFSANSFIVPPTAVIGSVYVLDIRAVDSRNQTTTLRYRFEVTE